MALKMDANPMSSNLVNITSTEPEVFLRDLYSPTLYIGLSSFHLDMYIVLHYIYAKEPVFSLNNGVASIRVFWEKMTLCV